MSEHFDVAVIGAGAAGLMAAAVAGQRGKRVVLIDHAEKLAEKIRISGGGRCNFTNLQTSPAQFISQNPDFCRSALSRYSPQDFLKLIQTYRIGWHEKHRGQLFCDESSEDIIRMLRAECDAGNVTWRMPCAVQGVVLESSGGATRFALATDAGTLHAQSVIVATGGLSIPKIGATDFGYRLARQFGLSIIEPRPALVPLTFAPEIWKPFAPLAGLALEVDIETGPNARRRGARFREDLLFTHRGLSGPAVLQISTYWDPGEALQMDLAPETDLEATLIAEKATSRQTLGNILPLWLPRSLAQGWLASQLPDGDALAARKLAEVPDKALRALAASLKRWPLLPSGTEGFRKAEVTRGGVDTRQLSQQTMEARKVPGLHFIGEVVDVTGWLGGYNFQWAWASGYAAGQAV